MTNFKFLQNPISQKWVILAPRRAKRPNVAKGFEPVCPFCLGREKDEPEVFRIGGQPGDDQWQVRVLNNKFPFAPIHEVIVHSPDHQKNFEDLPLSHVELILQTYKNRYLAHQKKGQVYIFHNRGMAGGESLPHPHTQITVVPFDIKMELPRLDPSSMHISSIQLGPKPVDPDQKEKIEQEQMIESTLFYMFCPITSQWPDEIWVAPRKRGRAFGEIADEEIKDLAFVLQRLIQIFDHRHNNNFPFNFYIYPMGDWYLRIIPRLKTIGGFELGTGIYINTQDPRETMDFIKKHFENPDIEKIKTEGQAEYQKGA